MNRQEYIYQLQKRLRKLPFDESREAIDYYEQYFEDAGEENVDTVIAELGSPALVASQIIAEFAVKDSSRSARWGLSGVRFAILAILASPLALPLALVMVVMAVSAALVMLCMIVVLGIAALSLPLSGICAVILSIPIAFQSVPSALFYFGMGLLSFGAGVALIIPAISLSKRGFGWVAKKISRLVLRRAGK